MFSRARVYRVRRRQGWRRRAAWADAGLTVTRRRARLTLYAQPWRDTAGPLHPNPPQGD